MTATAEINLAGGFGDHMVLQRDAILPVWGWAEPNERIAVRTAAIANVLIRMLLAPDLGRLGASYSNSARAASHVVNRVGPAEAKSS